MSINRISKFLLLTLLLISATVSLQAQDDTPFGYAAVVDNQLWVYTAEGEALEIDTEGARFISDPVFSEDGTLLAYIIFDENYESQLRVANVADGTTQEIVSKIEAGFPVSFQADNNILYAKYSEEVDPTNEVYRVDIWSSPVDGGEPLLLGTFQQGVGCGGGSNIPADAVYFEETQGLGGFHLILEETPYGILHSAECGGSIIALLDPATGEDHIISENFTRTALSPDRSKIAGIELNARMEGDNYIRETRLLVADLATLEITELTTSTEPDQLTFSADSESVFYSTRIESGDFYEILSAEDVAAFNAALGFDYGSLLRYTAAIREVDIASNTETEVFSEDGYAIGRMIALEDGSALIFSLVPNLDAWVDGIIAGSIDYNGDFETQVQVIPPVIYTLDLSDNTATIFGENLAQITIAD